MPDLTLSNLQQTINTGGQNGKPIDHARFDRRLTPSFNTSMEEVEAWMERPLLSAVIARRGEQDVMPPLQISDGTDQGHETLFFKLGNPTFDPRYEIAVIDSNNDGIVNLPESPEQLGQSGVDGIKVHDYLNDTVDTVTSENYAFYQPVLQDLNNRLSQATRFSIGSF